jgi:hypothetical protein
MPLVSTSQMAALEGLVKRGMETSVDIYPKVEVETPSDTEVQWPTKSQTVKGWMRSEPANRFDIDVGVTEAQTPFRLLLPVGTAIFPGDHVIIAGETYSVADTNVENTIKTSLRCWLRKLGT